MSLINKKAVLKQFTSSIQVTIVDSFVSKETQYKLIVMDENGKLFQASIQDLTILIVDPYPESFTVDWDYVHINNTPIANKP